MRDLATDMADEMDRRGAAASGERDTVEHCTAAAVMRSNGTSEERIVELFGYSPRPLDDTLDGEA